ncbi:MAG: dihydrodipicolinate synthase family protein [Nanoarchaeota archaeon]|nr:dihydrodipicolinate synthase family protein [Nanoarchaeota archaeon]MBU1974196.1 dihydrodipicolinate synthase family protein [Nanoarchaeota archaeon]
MENKLTGIIPPLVTPVDVEGNVCEKSVKSLIDFVSTFSSALMPTLSSGEGWALSKKQFSDMIKFTVKYSQNLPVFVGVEFKTTSEVIQYGKLAKKLGVDAIVITTPFNKNISQDDIYEHFLKVKKEVNLPIFVYNEKAISGNEILFSTLIKIYKLGDIIGIKEASGNPSFTMKLVKNTSIPVFQGWENLCLKSKGVDGYILPLCNLEPELCKKMLENPTQKHQDKIMEICKQYNLLNEKWYVYLKKELKRRKIIFTDRIIKEV